MVCVKMLARNETCVIDNGKVYLFDLGGRCSGEDVGNLPKYMNGALELPVVSILSCNGVVNIGVSRVGGAFEARDCDMDSVDCAMNLQKYGKYIKMLQRKGSQNGKRFNQLIFVYREDFDLSEVLSLVGF